MAMLGALVLVGCSHYTLGSASKLDFDSLYIAVAHNQSYAAQVDQPLSEQLRQTFLQEGNLHLADQKDADATLEVTVSDYKRTAAATQQGNTLNAQSYALTLTAKCTLADNRSGKMYFKDKLISVTEDTLVQNGDNFNESEYQAMPKLSRDLAVKVKDAVVTTW